MQREIWEKNTKQSKKENEKVAPNFTPLPLSPLRVTLNSNCEEYLLIPCKHVRTVIMLLFACMLCLSQFLYWILFLYNLHIFNRIIRSGGSLVEH